MSTLYQSNFANAYLEEVLLNQQLLYKHGIKLPELKLFINGEFTEGRGESFSTLYPATEEEICMIPEASREDVDLAVQSAHAALEGPWSRMSGGERSRLMHKFADLIAADAENLAKLETLDNGKPFSHSLNGDVPHAIDVLRYYAGLADKIQGETILTQPELLTYTLKEPVGVCAQIIPWNYPLGMAAWKLGPALAAGCTLVLKPAEQTSLTALCLAKYAQEAGFPAGVINVLPGRGEVTGRGLTTHPLVSKVAFTGDYQTALAIKADTLDSMKRLTFELGGKSPNIVFADADLQSAIDGAFNAIFSNHGQNCCAGSRLYVEKAIYSEFISGLQKKAESYQLGDPFAEQTQQGPQIDKTQMEKILGYIDIAKQDGGSIATGGAKAFDKGYFVEPTVLCDLNPKSKTVTEEIFGPVLCAFSFENESDVLEAANDTSFGLAAGVWTQDIKRAMRMSSALKAGTVWVNTYNQVDAHTPFGGFKNSGLGRELGVHSLQNYLENKTVTIAR